MSDTGGDSEKDSKEKIIGSPIIELEANKEMMDMHRKQKILDKKEKRKINTIMQLKLRILQGTGTNHQCKGAYFYYCNKFHKTGDKKICNEYKKDPDIINKIFEQK